MTTYYTTQDIALTEGTRSNAETEMIRLMFKMAIRIRGPFFGWAEKMDALQSLVELYVEEFWQFQFLFGPAMWRVQSQGVEQKLFR